MHTPPLFGDLLIILLVSVPVAFACLRLKLPLLVGLMLTGIVIGPYGLGLIKELEAIEILAEIGVMLLLFTIGLEFSLHRLREMKRLVLIGGGLQVGLTIAIFALIAFIFGRGFNQAVFFGFLVALSSTAIVLKSYAERKEIDAPHGRVGVGILIFQDISIVLMMLLVPVLGGKDAASFGSVIAKLGFSLLGLIVIVAAAWFLIPIMLKHIVRLKSPEVLLLLVVLLCLGISFVTAQFGLSLALGAFIAGMVLADTDYSHQVTADILPFRDVFNSIFFVSIGMLLSLSALFENLFTVILWVSFLVIGKSLIVWIVIQLLGFPQRVAAMTALGLAQIGEFSFVLAKAGRMVDLLPDSDYQSFLAASIISMIITPFMIAVAPRFGYFIQSIFPDKKTTEEIANESESELHITSTGGLNNHVIIVGYGLNGHNLARVLRAVTVSYTILDLNAETVREAKAKGEKINFGDSTRREVLQHAAIENANALVLAISDPQAARRTVKVARELNKKIYIVVRTRYISEITELFQSGADEVIPEEFETSIEIFSRVLLRYGVDRHTIETQIERVRRQGYEMLRSPSIQRVEMSNLNAALQAATTETIKLNENSPAIGKNLGELDLRQATGATLIAVVRGDDTKIGPGANYKLQENDILILFGKPEKIERAVIILQPSMETGGFNP
ncbi:MAG TPA: cation:proton antiporter [Pyrinomonadaceae bacterium]|nr:cation:proton antiporter [Pyrinomonadaceae bacterium]